MKRISILAAGVLSVAMNRDGWALGLGELNFVLISTNHFEQTLRCLIQTRLMTATCLLVWL